MSYEVRRCGVMIGRVDFTSVDRGMAVALGPFRPAEAYGDVRHVFRKYSDATPASGSPTSAQSEEIEAFIRERDTLDLTLIAEDGHIVPTGWIMIYDFYEEAGGIEGLECEAQLAEGPGSLT